MDIETSIRLFLHIHNHIAQFPKHRAGLDAFKLWLSTNDPMLDSLTHTYGHVSRCYDYFNMVRIGDREVYTSLSNDLEQLIDDNIVYVFNHNSKSYVLYQKKYDYTMHRTEQIMHLTVISELKRVAT